MKKGQWASVLFHTKYPPPIGLYTKPLPKDHTHSGIPWPRQHSCFSTRHGFMCDVACQALILSPVTHKHNDRRITSTCPGHLGLDTISRQHSPTVTTTHATCLSTMPMRQFHMVENMAYEVECGMTAKLHKVQRNLFVTYSGPRGLVGEALDI